MVTQLRSRKISSEKHTRKWNQIKFHSTLRWIAKLMARNQSNLTMDQTDHNWLTIDPQRIIKSRRQINKMMRVPWLRPSLFDQRFHLIKHLLLSLPTEWDHTINSPLFLIISIKEVLMHLNISHSINILIRLMKFQERRLLHVMLRLKWMEKSTRDSLKTRQLAT